MKIRFKLTNFNFSAWRKQLGLTQKAASAELGISRRQYQNIEGGNSPVDRRTILACLYLAEHPEILENNIRPTGD